MDALSAFTFLIVNIKQSTALVILSLEPIFTFLIVNIKQALAQMGIQALEKFTFLIVNIKLAGEQTEQKEEKPNLHSS